MDTENQYRLRVKLPNGKKSEDFFSSGIAASAAFMAAVTGNPDGTEIIYSQPGHDDYDRLIAGVCMEEA